MSIYIATVFIAVLSMLILVTFVAQNDTMTKPTKRAIVCSALLISIGALSECLGQVLNGTRSAFRGLHLTVKAVELSVTPFIPVVFSTAITGQKNLRYLLPILFAHTVIQFLSVFLGITFFVDGENVYHHAKYYFLYYIAIAVGCCQLVYTLVQFNKRFQSRSVLSLLLIAASVLSGLLAQSIENSIRIVWLTTSYGLIMFYLYYCSVILQTDGLTGLLNRRTFENRIRTEKRRVGILFFDVNGFKRINDAFGHQYGDRCLKTIADALRAAYGNIGRCYRIGGDEFCVITEKPAEVAEKRNGEFNAALDKAREKDPGTPTVAMGYAGFDPETDDMSDVIAYADRQMYLNKNRADVSD